MPDFKIAIIQHPPVFLNLNESLRQAISLTEEAASHGAQIIIFPETWLPGYPVWLDFAPGAGLWDHPPAKQLFGTLSENALSIGSDPFRSLLKVAQKTGTYLVMGAHEVQGGTIYNTMLYCHKNGKDYVLHRKLMPTYTERLLWGRGDGSTLEVLDTEYGNIGGLICWEHWMPLARAAMHSKNEVLHVAQWPMVKEMNLVASRHYAFEGGCFVAAAGCVLSKQEIIEGFKSVASRNNEGLQLLEEMPAGKKDLLLKGGSCVIAPNGTYLEEPVYSESRIIYAEPDLSLIKESRLFLDTDGHYARPDVFRLEVNERKQSNVVFKQE